MKKAIALLLTLVFSVLGFGLPVAVAETSAKTFTITDSDGAPYEGAEIALLEWDPSTGRIAPTEPETAGADGVAQINYDPDNGRYFEGYAILPPVGDYSHANLYGYVRFTDSAQSIAIQLVAANTVFRAVDESGDEVSGFSWISYPATGDTGFNPSYAPILRAGPFGLDLSTGLSSGQDYLISINPEGQQGVFFSEFGLRLSGASPSYSHTAYSDDTFANAILPELIDGTSVISLTLTAANFRGQLLDASRAPLSLSDGVSGTITIRKSLANGQVDFDGWQRNSQIASNGSFAALIESPLAGKYWPQFEISGSNSVPTFTGQPFYINANGDYSLSEAGPFTDPGTFKYEVVPPVPNFRVSIETGNAGLKQGGSIQLFQNTESGQSGYWGPGYSANSLASYSLEDGVYQLSTYPDENLLAGEEYELVVDSGSTTLRDSSGETVPPLDGNGNYRLQYQLANVNIKLVNPYEPGNFFDNFSVFAYGTEVENRNFSANNDTYSGVVGLRLPDGKYNLRVSTSSDLLVVDREYSIEMVGGEVASIKDSQTLVETLSTGGFFQLQPHRANLIATVHANGSPVDLSQFGLGARLENAIVDFSSDEQFRQWTQVKPDGRVGFYVSEVGLYKVTIDQPQGGSDFGGLTLGSVNVSNPEVVQNLGVIDLPLKNFKFSVTAPGKTDPLRNIGSQLSGAGSSYGLYTDTGTVAGAYISSAGTYELRVEKPHLASPSEMASTTYTLTVSDSGVGGFSITIPGVTPSGDGVFVLELDRPNVTGKLKSPSGATLDFSSGAWANVGVQKYDDAANLWTWTNNYADLDNKGNFGLNLNETGLYRMILEPYSIEGAGKTFGAPFEATNENLSGTVASFPDLRFSAPTATFKVYEPGSAVPIRYIGIEIRKDGQWLDWISTDQNGLASFTEEGAGSYEFRVHPPYNSDAVSTTYTGTVADVGGTLVLTLNSATAVDGVFALELGSPNLTGWLNDSVGDRIDLGQRLWVNVQVQRYVPEMDYWEWTDMNANVRPDGGFGLTIDRAGTFRLRFEPWGSQDYATTLSAEFTVTEAELADYSGTFNGLVLRAPALTGVVYGVDGTTPISDSQILPVDALTGQELWEYSKWTDREGRWALALPEGEYSLFARAPYQSTAYGDSAEITGLIVDAEGIASIGGVAVSSGISLQLSDPTWTGEVVAPNDTSKKLANASICLWQNNEGNDSSRCTQSNNAGQWALSKWPSFDDFNDTSVLTIRANQNPEFAEARYEGEAEIEGVLGAFSSGAVIGSGTGIQLSPALPNTIFTITAGSNGAPYVWVNVMNDDIGWLGGGSADANGVVSLNLETLAADMRVEIYVNSSGPTSAYTSTTKIFTQAQVAASTVGGQFAATIGLDTPNLRVKIYEPGTDGSALGDPVRDSYVDVYNETTDEWSRGSSSDYQGQASLRLPVPASGSHTYRFTVNPSYQNTGLLSRNIYYARINSAGEIEMHEDVGATRSVTAEAGVFPLTLAAPNLRGNVYRPGESSTKVQNSYVVPIDFSTRWELWEYGISTNKNGAFGMTLPDGTYYLKARAPWDERTLSDSAQCQVSVASELVTGDCVVGGQIMLRLREPNVKFKLLDTNGNPLKYTNVSISVGNWWSNAFSGEDGNISLLIDSAEIALRNPSLSGAQDIQIWVDPNQQSGIDAVRWGCSSGDSKPICAQLADLVIGQDYLPGGVDLGNITALGPNTTVTVLSPGDSPTPIKNTWVNLFYEESGWKRWLSSGATDANGKARFNIDDTYLLNEGARFSIEIEAPWISRSTFSRTTVNNLTYAELTGTNFELGTPNLKITVKDADGISAAKWAFIQVEEVDPTSYSYVSWQNGYGTDRSGVASLNLESGKTFRLTLYPGHLSEGSRTTCVFAVDGLGVVSKVAAKCGGQSGEVVSKAITLQLSAGNVAGRILNSSGSAGVSGAIVFAEAFNTSDGVASGETAEAVTSATGDYALQLDSSFDWKIKVFYVNPPAIVTPLASYLTPYSVSASDLRTADTTTTPKAVNITLVAK